MPGTMEYRNKRLVKQWYQSWQPNGMLWCETSSKKEFIQANRSWQGEGELDKYVIPVYLVVGPKIRFLK